MLLVIFLALLIDIETVMFH